MVAKYFWKCFLLHWSSLCSPVRGGKCSSSSDEKSVEDSLAEANMDAYEDPETEISAQEELLFTTKNASSDEELVEQYLRNSSYYSGDSERMREQHNNVSVNVILGNVGGWGDYKKGLIVEIYNNNEIGTIDAISIGYKLFDPFDNYISSGKLVITDAYVLAGTSTKEGFAAAYSLGQINIDTADSVFEWIEQIEWDNGEVTTIEEVSIE